MTLIPDHKELELEAQWITEAQKDIKHFELLYKKYNEPIFRFILRRTDNESLSEDICSQTFYKAMINLKHFQPMGKPLIAWLYTIAGNEVRKHFRDKKPVFVIEEEKLLDVEEIKNEWQHLAQEDLIRLLDDLEDSDLRLIELKYFEKLTFKEIALLMGIGESAVKMKLYRLLSRLKKKLEVYYDPI